jgi:hypothetical protein
MMITTHLLKSKSKENPTHQMRLHVALYETQKEIPRYYLCPDKGASKEEEGSIT